MDVSSFVPGSRGEVALLAAALGDEVADTEECQNEFPYCKPKKAKQMLKYMQTSYETASKVKPT